MKPSSECQERTYMIERLDLEKIEYERIMGVRFNSTAEAYQYAQDNFIDGTQYRIIQLVYQAVCYGEVRHMEEKDVKCVS